MVGLTVNLLAPPSVVQIHLPPPEDETPATVRLRAFCFLRGEVKFASLSGFSNAFLTTF